MKSRFKNTIFDKKRFKWMEKEKIKWLRNLSIEEAARITAGFLSSKMFARFKKNIVYNEPVSVAVGLRRKDVGTIIQENNNFSKRVKN